MQLLTLKIFCDLVELGSFSDSAKKNGITQSAVSQQIMALEERHGVSFFERGKKKFSVTPEGRLFEQAAREILEIYNSIDTRINGLTDKVAGTLRVSTVYSIGLHVLPAILKAFRAVHPKVVVKVDYKRSTRVYEDVLGGRVDMGLVPFPRNGGGINADIFDEDVMVVVCAPGHRLAKKKKMKLEDLQGESFVAFEPDTPTSKAIQKALRDHHVAFAQEHEFHDIE
ncbi:MAG: LysR family transcriptional regulator, partial [Verrucomicrobiaceae bacterium]